MVKIRNYVKKLRTKSGFAVKSFSVFIVMFIILLSFSSFIISISAIDMTSKLPNGDSTTTEPKTTTTTTEPTTTTTTTEPKTTTTTTEPTTTTTTTEPTTTTTTTEPTITIKNNSTTQITTIQTNELLLDNQIIIDNSGNLKLNSGDIANLWVKCSENYNVTKAIIIFNGTDKFTMSLTENGTKGKHWNYQYIVNNSDISYQIKVYDGVNESNTTVFKITVNDYYIKDTIIPTIIIKNPEPGSTIYDKTPKIIAIFDDLSGINIDTISLSVDGNQIDASLILSKEIAFIPTNEMSYGEHKAIVKVADNKGNIATKEWTFKIAESKTQKEEVVGNIIKGEEIEVAIESDNIEETYIESLEFTPTTDLENVKVSVAALEEKPEEIKQPTIKGNKPIYGYIDIKLTSDDEYIEDMSTNIKFNVEKEWIEENGLTANSIVLIRYHDGEWQELLTYVISSDEEKVYYEAITPGFSTFAVVGSSLVKIDDPYTNDSIPDIPFEIVLLLVVGIVSLLIIVIFKARYIYFKDEKITNNQRKTKK